jgi:RNA polymerase sigma-70 factor, ECF subfamily
VTDLVRRAQAGDQLAFERLYREHVGRVYAVCVRMVADRARAEELTQDVFVRVWESLGTFRGESAFTSWLHRLAVNTVLQAARGAARYRERVETTDAPELMESVQRGGGGSEGPGLRMDLERAIAALPAGAREVLVLYDIEGYSHQEIAGLVGIAPGTSKAQLHRARRLLREALGE